MTADAARAALNAASRVKEQQANAFRAPSYREPQRPPGARLPGRPRDDGPPREAPYGEVRYAPGKITLAAETVETPGPLKLTRRSGGLIMMEGLNARQGIVSLVCGYAVVENTSVTDLTRIFVCSQQDNGIPGWLRVTDIIPGVSFTILSSSQQDDSEVAFWMSEGCG